NSPAPWQVFDVIFGGTHQVRVELLEAQGGTGAVATIENLALSAIHLPATTAVALTDVSSAIVTDVGWAPYATLNVPSGLGRVLLMVTAAANEAPGTCSIGVRLTSPTPPLGLPAVVPSADTTETKAEMQYVLVGNDLWFPFFHVADVSTSQPFTVNPEATSDAENRCTGDTSQLRHLRIAAIAQRDFGSSGTSVSPAQGTTRSTTPVDMTSTNGPVASGREQLMLATAFVHAPEKPARTVLVNVDVVRDGTGSPLAIWSHAEESTVTKISYGYVDVIPSDPVGATYRIRYYTDDGGYDLQRRDTFLGLYVTPVVPPATFPDAGTPDAGVPDGGMDAGEDAGSDGGADGGGDGGSDGDGGNDGDAGPPARLRAGCSCSSAPGVMALAAVVAALVRRRIRRPRQRHDVPAVSEHR
ncbi:MAG TPA: MYXO-CTERM sorting domain-containing protein, partial [Myxococcales bacterium]|nr:MYXO-CTERM sorting domain-containing protein [Myxococcales bacterium]